MASSWSIKIVKLPNGKVAFQPDLPNAQPGQPLGVNKGDFVTWNNETDEDRHPVATSGSPPPYLTEDIPAGEVSDPIFKVSQNAGTTITYVLAGDSSVQGSIVVS